jgi:ATP-dependent HslUV protease, peptidase subunit HslV
MLTLCCCYFLLSFIAAARALMDFPDLSAEDVAKKAMNIAADMCVYTNHNFLTEVIDAVEPTPADKEA